MWKKLIHLTLLWLPHAHSLNATQQHPCVGRVLLGVWTSAKTKARRRPVLETWFVKGCVVWLSCCEKMEDTLVTGGPDTYLGVTYRGLMGLKMMRAHKKVPWYGILGDDNYVHWPSLLRGLERHDSQSPVVAGEKVSQRFMGGAGIFHNAAFADRVDHLIAGAAQASLHSKEVHDLYFSRFVHQHARDLELGDDPLTHLDFVFSTEPGVYICGHSQHLAETWSIHPPAVFPRFRTLEHMHRIHSIASEGGSLERPRADGIMKRTRFIAKVHCTVGQIANRLCHVWNSCSSRPPHHVQNVISLQPHQREETTTTSGGDQLVARIR